MNPTQTPLDASDQLVYALTKELQYCYPYLLEKYCPIMGGLHIEQSVLGIHGQLSEGSGLVKILILHKFSAIGLSVITDASHIKTSSLCHSSDSLCSFFEITRSFSKIWSELESLILICFVKKSQANRMCFI